MLQRFRFVIITALSLIVGLSFLGNAKAQQQDEARKAALRAVLRKAEDEYRLYFKRPKEPLEFWAAINFEVELGKFDLAALHLDQLLKLPKESTDQKLLEVEEAQGMAPFLRLKRVKRWSKSPILEREAQKNVDTLIDRIQSALEKKLSDPIRIQKYIQQLFAETPEERSYAFVQLARAKERASPYLVDALRLTAGTLKQDQLKNIILRLPPETINPMAEVLNPANLADYRNVELRYAILDLFHRSGNKRAIPYLWYMRSSPRFPDFLRKRAEFTLAKLLKVEEERLPDSRVALTNLAEDYFQHKVRFKDLAFERDPKDSGITFKVKFWSWDGKRLSPQPILKTPAEAELFYGVRHAREALDLDPQYQPAQIVFLNLALSHTFGPRRHLFLHHPVRESPQELKDIFFAMENLLGPLDSDLLLATLERALDDRNTAVILPLVRILGKRGEQKARLVTGKAKGLIRALFYPNRRVQIEAIRSLISLKEKQSPIVTHRIVQLLSRFANSKGIPKALVVRVPEGEALEYRKNLKAAGYEAVLAPDQKAALEALHESADYDVILLHPSFPITELSFLLGQIRSDADGGLLPIMVFAPSDRQAGLQFLTSRYRNVFVKLEAVALLPKELQAEIHEAIAFSKIPNSVTRMPDRHRGWIDEMVLRNPGMGITKPERIAFAPEAVNVLWRMATGDLSGYNVSPARDAMLEILSSDNQMAFEALEVLGTFGDQKTQRFLVRVVLDSARDAQIRAQAASVLNKHIRKNGLVLSAFQIDDLRVLLEDPKTDKDLRSKLALVAGQFPGADLLSGQRLRDFRLTPVRPAVPPKEAPKK